MGVMSTMLGKPIEFEYKGQTYKMAPLTNDVQALYERYLESEVIAAAERMATQLPKGRGEKLLAQVYRDIAAGLYTFGQEEVVRSLDCNKHFIQLIFLCIQAEMPQVTYGVVKQMVEENQADMIAKFNVANADPTTPTTP